MRNSHSLSLLSIAIVVFILGASDASAFGPCSRSFPKELSYYPTMSQCGGKAALIVTGRLKDSFSLVVRACDNGDRDPCFTSIHSCGTNASSPFKVQKTIEAIVDKDGEQVPAKIHCLKEPGTSQVYRMVRRITIKRVNPVRNPSTDVLRICLPSRTKVVNQLTIVSTGRVTNAGGTGYNSSCQTQRYLGCNIEEAIQRVCPMRWS